MKSSVWLLFLASFLFTGIPFSSAQQGAPVDTTWLFYTYKSNGDRIPGDDRNNGGGQLIDIRLAGTNLSYYLDEGKTFSFRKVNGVNTNSYYPMAGFTSFPAYTQGNLRRIFFGNDTYEMNYRLMFPKNYNLNPNYPGGYPLIVMVHGFGERGNCWGTNCYWPNPGWNPNHANTISQNNIVSVEKEFPAQTTSHAVFTTSSNHGFLDHAIVFISGSHANYNGYKRLRTISGQPNKFKISNELNNIANTGVVNFISNVPGTVERRIAQTVRIISVTNDGGNALFTTDTPHQFSTSYSNQVIITNSTVAAYNGTKTVSFVTATTFRLSNTPFAGNATADVARSGIYTLLNNDHSMTHGGRVHMDIVNAVPTGMTPDDPLMPSRAFPGFLLFPQNLNGWAFGGIREVDNVIRLIRLLVKKYNIDPNRIYIHGLSDGGAGTYRIIRSAPWLFAAGLPMSAVDNGEITNHNLFKYVNNLPFWLFQGGTDGNPTVAETNGYLQAYRNNGMNVRYTLYPTLGHGTWNAAYAEPDFFTWMRSRTKRNPQILYGISEICATSGAGVEMVFAQGFLDYQWERDGEIIPGANEYKYIATVPGTYRGRFSRKLNPGPNDWNPWSDPIQVTESVPVKPTILANNSVIFPNTSGAPGATVSPQNAVTLTSSIEAEKYRWYRDGELVPDAQTGNQFNQSILRTYNGVTGVYTLKTATLNNCESLESDPVYAVWGSLVTIPDAQRPSNFTGIPMSSSSVALSWSDNSPNETGFEIWRRKAGEIIFQFIKLTKEDEIYYIDQGLEANTTYEYKLRAVNQTGRSNHVPSNNTAPGPANNLVVTTGGDTTPPTPPQNLQVVTNDIDRITLQWDAATDNNGIKQYRVYYGGNMVATNSNATTYTIMGLPINTAYAITVRAEDFATNVSPPSNQVTGTTYVEGLFYMHSTGAWNSLDPQVSAGAGDTPPIQWITAEFTGKMPNFNVNPKAVDPNGFATQEDFYNFKFDGYLNIPSNSAPQTQIYQFRITSDDGSMLFLDDFDPNDVTAFRYANNDGLHGPVTVPPNNPNSDWDITLSPGPHRIVVLFNEYTGGQMLTVEYRIKNTNNSYTGWSLIPNSMLRTGTYIPPTPPNAPTNLSALAAGMTTVNLTWLYGGAPADEFEVHRSQSADGTYVVVGRATGLAFSDVTALPGITYFYKLKTVNANGTSAFSNMSQATTDVDSVVPSVPTGLTLLNKTYSNVAFRWTASTDNIGVAGYEILINGVVHDTTAVASYMATNLFPATLYTFTVKAFDASGNTSAASAPLAVTTNSGQMFYSKADGPLNETSTWGNQTNGEGTEPNFSYNGQVYVIANRSTTGLGGDLTIGGSVSRIIVPTGTNLVVDNMLQAKVEVQGNATVTLDHDVAPQFLSISPASTVVFNTVTSVPLNSYGNIELHGTGTREFQAGETTIYGNIIADDGIGLKGVPGNQTSVTLHGNLTISGVPTEVAPDNAINLSLVKNGTQTITTGGGLDFYRISTTSSTNVTLVNSSAPVTLHVGSSTGGGLTLANGSTFTLGTNHLVMKNAGSINAGGETGRLAINGSNLNLTSTGDQHSNLYFDPTLRTAGLVTSDFSGAGICSIKSPLVITNGLKLKNGEFSAGGNVTLISNATETAYLQEIEGNGVVTGNMNVQRWVSIARKYRYMSSAVADMKVADWQPYMPITGPFTGSSPNSSNPSMFYYVENDGGYKHYPHTGSNNQVTFERGRGYSIFNYNGNAPLTLVMTGNPYQGSVPYTLTPGTGGNDGWNLMGNPYASAIQWNDLITDWTRSGLSPVVHVPDNTGGSLVFRTWDAESGQGTLSGGIIAPGQAFWVQSVTASPSLTIHEKAKRTNTSTFFREGDGQLNSITVRLSSSTLEDDAYIIFSSAYTDAYEPEADGMKLKNGMLNLSTKSSDQVNLVFNKVSDSFCEKTIALNIEDVTPGNYSLSFFNVASLSGIGQVTLHDNFVQTTRVLQEGDTYNFAVSANAASFGSGRFTLSFNRPQLINSATATVQDVCGGTEAFIQLTNTQSGVFYYASRPGDTNAISNQVESNGGTVTLTLPLSTLETGNNQIVIHTGFKGCSNELLSATPLEFTYTPKPAVQVEEALYSICAGSGVNLNAITAEDGYTYRWYKNNQLIAGQTSASLQTGPIAATSIFEVAPVTTSGCEGFRSSVLVEVENVPFPSIEFTGDVLELTDPVSENMFIQWYLNQEPLEVFTPFIEPKEEGQYTVLLSYKGCSQISDPFNYTNVVTGVEGGGTNSFMAYVYPNPATSQDLYVKIESVHADNVEIIITDLTGREAFTATVRGEGVHRLNLSQETIPGLYILSIRQGSRVLQRKVIITFR